MKRLSLFIITFISQFYFTQYQPKNLSSVDIKKANSWVDITYNSLSQDEKLGQLFIVALYTNKGEDFINQIRNIVVNDKIGGLILMQDDAAREINLVNEFQSKSKVPLMIGMDAEWGYSKELQKHTSFPGRSH
jgi:hypothetical protein